MNAKHVFFFSIISTMTDLKREKKIKHGIVFHILPHSQLIPVGVLGEGKW